MVILMLIIHAVSLAPPSLAAGMKLGDMCRLKGQETNTLHGLGLVVGLRGTGDADAAPTARALAPEIRVNSVAPGFIAGEWLQEGLGDR